MTTETPAAVLRARITRALDECRTMIPAAQADVVLSVLRKATQPEIKAAVLGTTEQPTPVTTPWPPAGVERPDHVLYTTLRKAGFTPDAAQQMIDTYTRTILTEQADTVAAPARGGRCPVMFQGGGRCEKDADHRAGRWPDDPHTPEPAPAPAEETKPTRSVSPIDEVRAWNEAHPVGTPVRVWTGFREGDGTLTRTRSRASVLGTHTAVVWVEGEGSCISLSHVDPAP